MSENPQTVTVSIHNPNILRVDNDRHHIDVILSHGPYNGQVTMMFTDPAAMAAFGRQLVTAARLATVEERAAVRAISGEIRELMTDMQTGAGSFDR